MSNVVPFPVKHRKGFIDAQKQHVEKSAKPKTELAAVIERYINSLIALGVDDVGIIQREIDDLSAALFPPTPQRRRA